MPAPASAKGCQGFTLLELGIVMLLVAVLAFYAVPRLSFRTFTDIQLRDELLNLARQTQQLAMNRDKAKVELVLTTNSYGIRIDGQYLPDALNQSYPKALPTGFSLSPAPLTLSFTRLGDLETSLSQPVRILGGGGAQFCLETSGYARSC